LPNAVRSTCKNGAWELGRFVVVITAAVCAFALKVKLMCKAIDGKILLQNHECAINPQKLNSDMPS